MTLYVSDLDGTLLGRDEKLSPFTVETLNRLVSQGMRFTYATARSFHSARRVTAGLTARLPAIVYNGAFIIDTATGERLWHTGFSPEEAAWVRDAAGPLNLWPVAYAFVEGTERLSWIAGQENPGQAHYLRNRQWDPRLRPVEGEAQLYQGEAFYFTFIGEKEQLLPLYERARALPWANVTFQQELYRTEYWLELMPKAASKAHAAQKLRELLGCGSLVAFGDAVNDLPLFQAADIACAVANAVPELKAAATEVIGGNEEGGVARWLLEHWEKRRAQGFFLRPYRGKELEEVLALFYHTVRTVCRQDYTPEQLEAWAPPLDRLDRGRWGGSLQGHFTLVAEDTDGRLAGFADLDGGYLDRLYVRQDFQGRGVGRALVEALERQARRTGQQTLETHASRTAQPFFQHMGYRLVCRQQVSRPHPATGKAVGLENAVMEKAL